MKKKVLILGSEGFIGKNLQKKLVSENYSVSGADLLDINPVDYKYYKLGRLQPEFEMLFKDQQFDYCINAAGSGNVPLSIEEPFRDYEANVSDTFKLLNAIRIYNPACLYIHFSSAAVYGNPQYLPITEDSPMEPVSPYGYHKLIAETICKEFVKLYNQKVIIVRPFSAYGPGLRKQLFWDLYSKIKVKNYILLQGTGLETRDFIYIADLVDAVLMLMEAGNTEGDVYNIASGVETTIKQIASLFVKQMNREIQIEFDQKQKSGIPISWCADISKIQQLKFTPAHSIEQGLAETFQWLSSNA